MFKLRDEVIDLEYGYGFYGWQLREDRGDDIKMKGYDNRIRNQDQ